MSDTPETEKDEIGILIDKLDELITESIPISKPIGLTLCDASRTIAGQRDRITELWSALELVRRERDEARKELVRMDEVYAHEARKERDAMWGELSVLKADLKEAKDRCLQLKLALDEARGELEFRYTLNQHADKSSVDDSTYVLTQPPCQRISWVGTETDWHAEGYRDGKAVALLPGGTRGAKWHADQKQLQGDAAYEYIDGFNNALDEHEQEEAK